MCRDFYNKVILRTIDDVVNVITIPRSSNIPIELLYMSRVDMVLNMTNGMCGIQRQEIIHIYR